MLTFCGSLSAFTLRLQLTAWMKSTNPGDLMGVVFLIAYLLACLSKFTCPVAVFVRRICTKSQ